MALKWAERTIPEGEFLSAEEWAAEIKPQRVEAFLGVIIATNLGEYYFPRVTAKFSRKVPLYDQVIPFGKCYLRI